MQLVNINSFLVFSLGAHIAEKWSEAFCQIFLNHPLILHLQYHNPPSFRIPVSGIIEQSMQVYTIYLQPVEFMS